MKQMKTAQGVKRATASQKKKLTGW